MSADNPKTVAFTGGGTGGHVYPALALIDELKKNESIEFVWIGSKGGMEESIIKDYGLPYYALPAGKLRRYFSFQNFLDLFKICWGFLKAMILLKKLKPDLVFSKGGFVSVTPVLAAKVLKIPVLAHESDTEPGLATRINLRSVKKLFVPYHQTAEMISPRKGQEILVSGNPVRSIFFNGNAENGRKFVGAGTGKPLLLIVGGSSGAKQINDLTESILDSLLDKYYVVHQMGDKLYKPSNLTGYYSAPYFKDEMADILAAADLCISRAGAGSLWELAATATPAILIPLSTAASRGDQIKNAEIFRDSGLAEIFDGNNQSATDLLKVINGIVDNADKLNKMTEAARLFPGKDAVEVICSQILKELKA